MELLQVIEDYVASRRNSSAVSTGAAAREISMLVPLSQLPSKREFENLVAEAAVRSNLAVHFDAVGLPTSPVGGLV